MVTKKQKKNLMESLTIKNKTPFNYDNIKMGDWFFGPDYSNDILKELTRNKNVKFTLSATIWSTNKSLEMRNVMLFSNNDEDNSPYILQENILMILESVSALASVMHKDLFIEGNKNISTLESIINRVNKCIKLLKVQDILNESK